MQEPASRPSPSSFSTTLPPGQDDAVLRLADAVTRACNDSGFILAHFTVREGALVLAQLDSHADAPLSGNRHG